MRIFNILEMFDGIRRKIGFLPRSLISFGFYNLCTISFFESDSEITANDLENLEYYSE